MRVHVPTVHAALHLVIFGHIIQNASVSVTQEDYTRTYIVGVLYSDDNRTAEQYLASRNCWLVFSAE